MRNRVAAALTAVVAVYAVGTGVASVHQAHDVPEPIRGAGNLALVDNSEPDEPGTSTQQPEDTVNDQPPAVDPGESTIGTKCTPGLSPVKINRLLDETGYIFHVTIDDCGPTDVGARCSFKYQPAQGGNIAYFYVDSHVSRASHYCTDVRSLLPKDWKVTVRVIGEVNGDASVSRYFTILADGSVMTRAS